MSSSALDECVALIVGKIPSLDPESLKKVISTSFGSSKKDVIENATRIKDTERPGCKIHGSASIIVYGHIGIPINFWHALREYVTFLMWEREAGVIAQKMGITHDTAHVCAWEDIYDALANYLASFFPEVLPPLNIPPLEDGVESSVNLDAKKISLSMLSSTSVRLHSPWDPQASLYSFEWNVRDASDQSPSSPHPVGQLSSQYSDIRTSSNPPTLARHKAFLDVTSAMKAYVDEIDEDQCDLDTDEDTHDEDSDVDADGYECATKIIDTIFPTILTPEVLKLTKDHLISEARGVLDTRLGTTFSEFVTKSEPWQLTLENSSYIHELRQIIRGMDQHEVDSVKRDEMERNIRAAIVRMVEPKSTDIKDGSIFHELCWIVGPGCNPVGGVYVPTVEILTDYVVKMFIREVGAHISIV